MVTTSPGYVAFIPVRGDSKSIPLKNIKPICGRPLVYWVLDAAMQCEKIDRVFVSTDNREIKEAVLRYPCEKSGRKKLVCLDRDPAIARDETTTEAVMLDFADRYEFAHMVLIQATSPLLTAADLSRAITRYEGDHLDSLLSVVRQKRFLWTETAEGAVPQNYDFRNRPRRQVFDGCLVENGAFYLTGREALLQSQNRLSGKIGLYEMDEASYYEIDEPADWGIVEGLLLHRSGKDAGDPAKIRLFATDCDGVMTDGGMYYSESGDEMKKFNTLDGMGFALLRAHGIKTAIITGEDTRIVANRAGKIRADHLYQGVQDKLPVLREIAEQEGISLEEVAYVGDDINDLDCLEACGIGITVPGAMDAVKDVAKHITLRAGGEGAVREAIDYILRMQNG
jgi:N-acylneuraminate cytidylyltransferase